MQSSFTQRFLGGIGSALIFLSLLIGGTARSATISWSAAPVSHSDLTQPASANSVSTLGALVAAVNAAGGATNVNGVPFEAGTENLTFSHSNWSVPGVSWGTNAGGMYASNASTLQNAANTWLNTAKYYSAGQSSANATLNLLGLTAGNRYLVQLYFADIRTVYSVDARTVSVDGGVTKHRFAFCPSGGPYGYLILNGIFTADASSQSISMNCYSPGGTIVGPQINAYQIRNITGVGGAPMITGQPQSQEVDSGETVNFSVSATGLPPFAYQWYRNDTLIDGATGSNLQLTGVTTAQAGSYHVTVTNGESTATSLAANLTVRPPIDVLDPTVALDAYNTLWTTPSVNDRGAMPIGNGEVGLMLWVEANGDLQFYIARTDSRTELDRLVKLGKVRVTLSPNPFATGQPFRQLLRLRDGRVEITAGTGANEVTLRVFVDSDSPTIHVAGTSAAPISATATYETWRTTAYTGNVGSSAIAGSSYPNPYESADVVDASVTDRLTFYHRNAWSCVAACAQAQSMGAYLNDIPDTLLNRTFGGVMTLSSGTISGTNSLSTTSPVTEFDLKITAHTAQTATLADWTNQVTALHTQAPAATAAQQRTAQWWADYWARSWLYVKGDTVSPLALGFNGQPLRIGADSTGGSKFAGAMARCSFYGRVLTAAEVTSLAQGAPDSDATVTGGLVESWLLGTTANGVCIGRRGSGLNLTVTGGTVTPLATTVSQAQFAGGYFSGTDDPRFEPAAGLTQEAWIFLNPADANTGRLFDKTTANQTDGYLLDMYPGRALRLLNGADGLGTASNVINASAWVHIAATYDNLTRTKALYVNGTLVSQSTPPVSSDPTPSAVTRAYILTKWMNACGARGNHPIMFNGSLWTVMPNISPISISNNPDYRNWDHTFFYQNTRLPYVSMLARGESDFITPFFNYYRAFWELNRKRAIEWHGAEGQFNNEMTTTFGLLPGGIYGYNRTGLPKWYTANQYGGAVTISPGLELLTLMLDRVEHTGDDSFLQSDILPYAQDLLRFIETRFPSRNDGKIVMSPIHSVETFHNTTNATTVVAGMHSVLDRLLALPDQQLSGSQRAYFTSVKAITPPVPTQVLNQKTVLAPANSWGGRQNVEVPELYPIFPYRLYGVGLPGRALGVDSFEEIAIKRGYFRPFTIGGALYVDSFSGWQQLPMEAAMLGLTDYAKVALTQNCQLSNAGYRFRAMWGPIYDSMPDGDHGANILNTAQLMAFQTVADKILLLPAWPKDWDVSFKFHAPKATTVSGTYRNGVLEKLEVIPASRMKDVVLMADVPVTASDNSSVSGYDAWRLNQFHGCDLDDPDVWEPNADPDCDGLSNNVEYGLGTAPDAMTPSPFQAGNIGGKLTLEFTRNTATHDLTISVLAADHLNGPWSELARSVGGAAFVVTAPGATAMEGGSGPTRTVSVQDLYFLTDTAHPHRFLRLQMQ